MADQLWHWRRQLPVALTGCALAGTVAQAAVPGETVAEVLVTAQRTVTAASRTPVSLAVLPGDVLAASGVDHLSALGARLPSVHLDGAADGLRITIRGVSNNDTTSKGDPSAAFMQDGIYIARPQSQDNVLLDVARVEVLRGPQGTLYGRNATAGVVHVLSNTPGSQFEGAVSYGAGNYGSRRATGMLNVPVGQSLALRAALAYNKHDSFLINGQRTGYRLGLDRDDIAARLSARLAIGPSASLLLRFDSSAQDQNQDSTVPVTNFYASGADGMPRWIEAGTGARLTNGFIPANAPLEQGFGKARTSGVGAELDWNLGAFSLHYLGAHRSFDNDFKVNYYYRLAPTFALGVRSAFTGHYEQNSHEVRIATSGAGALSAQAGLYYLREESDVVTRFRDLEPLRLPPHYVFPQGPTIAVGKAIFGQATYRLAERLRATAGLRYSDDDKSRIGSTNLQRGPDFNPATDARLLNAAFLNTHKSTWRLGAEYDLAPATMAFATVSTGYKAGGFNDGCLAGTRFNGIDCSAAGAVPESTLLYLPETLTSYEAGLKSRFWSGKASIGVTAFYYDYNNLQLSGVAIVQNVPRFVTNNAGQAHVKGLEIEGQASPTPLDKISYALTLLDARYDSYRPDGVTSWQGRRLDRSPQSALSIGYERAFVFEHARLQAGVVTNYSDDYVISVPSQLLQYTVPSRTRTDLTLAYLPAQGSWSLHGHVRNAENRIRPIAIDSFGMVVPGAPRTYGARIEYRF